MSDQGNGSLERAFAELAVPEGFRAELIDGEIVLSPSVRRLHWRLMRAIAAQITPQTDWECVIEQTIKHPDFLDLPEPDLAVLPYSDEPAEDGEYNDGRKARTQVGHRRLKARCPREA